MKGRHNSRLLPFMIAAMTGCVALSLVELAELVVPEWSGAYLVVGCIVASLAACYSYRLIQEREIRGSDALRLRAIELLLLLILVKAASFLGTGLADVAADLRLWPSQPERIFGMGDLLASALVLGSWLSATATVRDLDRIDDDLSMRQDNARYARSVTGRIFWGGALLMVASGLTRMGIASILSLERVAVPRVVANVLAYFVLGLAIMGHIRLTRLRRQWRSQEIAGTEGVQRYWARYSLVLVVVAVVLALLIPIGYAGGILGTGAAVVNAVLYALMVVAWLLSSLVGLVLWFISGLFQSLFGDTRPERPPMEPPPDRSQAPLAGPPMAIPDWLEMARTVVFWIATIAMVGYVIWSYLRDHPEILEAIRRLRLVAALRSLFAQIRGRVASAVESVRQMATGPTDGQAGRTLLRIPRLRTRSPRQRIIYYYLSILRRASGVGISRRPHQTPYEYREVLAPHLDEAEGDMATLTEAFLAARYSPHEVDRESDRRAKTRWRAVRKALVAIRSRARGAEHQPR